MVFIFGYFLGIISGAIGFLLFCAAVSSLADAEVAKRLKEKLNERN